MLFERLIELREQLGDQLPPPRYQERELHWGIELDPDGRFLGWGALGNGKKGLMKQAPFMRRVGANAPPFLLVDDLRYVLGVVPFDDTSTTAERAAAQHAAFVAQVQACRDAVPERARPPLDAVLAFLGGEAREAALASLPPKLKRAHNLAFYVEGKLAHLAPAVQVYWASLDSGAEEDPKALITECIACGERRPILQTHPVDVRVGPDPAPLVSADKAAFTSYGLKRGEICPVCASCARQYGEALRYVLMDDGHRYTVGGVTYGFWCERPEEDFDPFSLIREPKLEDVKALLRAPFQPGELGEVHGEGFYALGATANKRLVIRDWITTSVPRVKAKLAAWFERQALMDLKGQPGAPHGVFALASSLVFDARGKMPPRLVPALLRAALLGDPVPFDLVAVALRRMRADSDNRLTLPRAKVIRLALNDRYRQLNREDLLVRPELNLDDPRPAYLCGRLFATLEAAQRQALGDINATVADRFFGTASAAPASVFGRLMRGSQAHLQKLRKTNSGAFFGLQQQIEEITSKLPAFPRTLSLEEQGLFALGYYHQRGWSSHLAAERKAAKEAAAQNEASSVSSEA